MSEMSDDETFCARCGQRHSASGGHDCDGSQTPVWGRSRRLILVAIAVVLAGALGGGGLLLTRGSSSTTAAPTVSSTPGQPPTPSPTVSVEVTVTVAPEPVVATPSPEVAAPAPASTIADPGARRIDVPAGTVVCSTEGVGVAATSMADNTWTSCLFADIVRGRYREVAPQGGAVWLPAVYTPKFNRYWDLQCENTEPVHCYAPADGQVVVYLAQG